METKMSSGDLLLSSGAVDEVSVIYVVEAARRRGGAREEVLLYSAYTLETAERLARTTGFSREVSTVKPGTAFRVGATWYVPGYIYPETPADAANRRVREDQGKALERARAVGLTEAEINAIRGSSRPSKPAPNPWSESSRMEDVVSSKSDLQEQVPYGPVGVAVPSEPVADSGGVEAAGHETGPHSGFWKEL